MRVAPLLLIAMLACLMQARKPPKPKPTKTCKGKDGKSYKLNKWYEKECKRYTCTKNRRKLMMVETVSSTCCQHDGKTYKEGDVIGVDQLGGCSQKITSCAASNGKTVEIKDVLEHGTCCLYEGRVLPVGQKIPQTKKCQWIRCSRHNINGTFLPSLSTEEAFPGCDCCLGEDGQMYKEGQHLMFSGVENSCCKGSWLVVTKTKPPTGPTGFNLVVTGGYSNGPFVSATSELVTSDGVCSHNVPPLPMAVQYSESTYVNNYLLLCGGFLGGYSDSCYKLHNSTSSTNWTKGPSMNKKRREFSLTKVGQELIVMGGRSGYGSQPHDAIEKYSDGKWNLLNKTMITPRHSHCTVHMKTTNSLVVIGGVLDDNTHTNIVEDFNLSSHEWTTLTPPPISSISSQACEVLQERGEETIYMTGGDDGVNCLSKVWKYSGKTWKLAGELKAPRCNHKMAILAGKLMVMGGHYNEKLPSIETMDEKGNWKKFPPNFFKVRLNPALAAVPAEAFPCRE